MFSHHSTKRSALPRQQSINQIPIDHLLFYVFGVSDSLDLALDGQPINELNINSFPIRALFEYEQHIRRIWVDRTKQAGANR